LAPATEPAAGLDEIQAQLQEYYGPRAQVSELTRLSDGWESDVYGFLLSGVEPARELVLRCYFGSGASRTAAREFAGLRLLRDAGYPVPEVFGVEPDGATLGRPFMVMAKAPGRLLRSRMDGERRYLDDFCALLVQLHRLEWAPEKVDPSLIPSRTIAAQLAHLSSYLERSQLPGFVQALAWLNARVVDVLPVRLALLHWDFHPANILVDENYHYMVIDWTQIEISDPRFDLAWTLLLTGSHASWELAALIQQGYEALSGGPVRDLDFFEAAACAKRLFAVLTSLSQGAEAMGMRPGAEQIMAGQLGRIAEVYRRWLALTAVPLAEAERCLAAHL
jgi:aminoglycoside phosphotransferase (APT) family kinase protein